MTRYEMFVLNMFFDSLDERMQFLGDEPVEKHDTPDSVWQRWIGRNRYYAGMERRERN